MGYRSDIRVMFKKAGYEKFKELYNKSDEFKLEKQVDEVIKKNNNVLLKINDVKWYDTYEEVEHFNEKLEEITEFGFSYRFVRIGEDNRDIEELEHIANNECNDLPYISIVTQFEDDYILENMEY